MTWDWQEWVVALLIVLCVARMVYGIYNFFRSTKNNENPCASSVSYTHLTLPTNREV